MRTVSLLVGLLAALMMAACVAKPITPFYVAEYPATWTPGPTSTNTPKPPTATRVVQQTAGPAPTRDPNARRLPSAPRGGIGVWLDVSGLSAESLTLLMPRAQILVEDGESSAPRTPGNFYLFRQTGEPLPENFGTRYDGVLVAATTTEELGALREQIKPRLVIAELNVQEEADAAGVFENADGLCFCNFLKEADTESVKVKTEAAWKRDVDTLAALTADPDAVVLTATRFSEEKVEDFQEMQFWLDYSLASFLLGVNNSRSFFSFQGKGVQEFLGAPVLLSKLGTPLGAMTKANAVYQRRFTNGLVIVNPTLEERGFVLSRNYLDVNGRPTTTVQLQPAAGAILLNAE